MPLGCRTVLVALLALAPVQLAAQGVPAHQQPAVNAIVNLIRQFEGQANADAIRQGFENGTIRIAPVPDNDNADTNTDTQVITLNPALVQQIHRADGKQSFKATADWAATLKHELVHAQQSTRTVIVSNIRRALGAGCPHEVAGWRAGFQSYYDWIQAARGRMGGGSEADREAAALQLRDLIKGFNEYRQNYPQGDFGNMRITGRDGVPADLSEAAQEIQGMEKEVNAVLDRLDFVVTTIPMVQNPKKGETFTVSANPRGGAFDTPSAANRESLYTYAWYADGAPLGLEGRTISRKAIKNENLTVQVTDRLARKRSGTCKVTVKEDPKPVGKPPVKPPPARHYTPGRQASGSVQLTPPSSGRKLHAPPDALFQNNPQPPASRKTLENQMNALRERHRQLKAQLDRSGGNDAATSREMTAVYQEYLAVKRRYDAMK
jgi:hypothetical protein